MTKTTKVGIQPKVEVSHGKPTRMVPLMIALFGVQKPWVLKTNSGVNLGHRSVFKTPCLGYGTPSNLRYCKTNRSITEVMLLIFLIFMLNHPGAY